MDGTATTACCNSSTAVIAVVVHGRFVGWVTCVGGWLMGRWVILYLRAQPHPPVSAFLLLFFFVLCCTAVLLLLYTHGGRWVGCFGVDDTTTTALLL